MQVEELHIQSSVEELEKVDNTIERIATEMGFDESARADLAICVTEAVNNAIMHGHKFRVDKKVDIRFEKNSNELKVVIRDHGDGYNVEDIPDPTLPENLMKLGGRGIHIIKTMMDNLIVERLSDGMKLTLVKQLQKVAR